MQLSFALPLVDLLWEDYGGEDWATSILEAPGGGIPTGPVEVVVRLCAGATLEVEGFGTYTEDPDRICTTRAIVVLSSDGTSMYTGMTWQE